MICRRLTAYAASVGTLALSLSGLVALPAAPAFAETPNEESLQLVAAPEQAKHPTVGSLWADSSAGENEKGVNGTVAALVDEDPATPSDSTTFWNTNWKTGDAYPHALAFDAAGFNQVCGVAYTSRPTYKGTAGQINGAKDSPAKYKVFALTSQSLNDSTWSSEWKSGVTGAEFRKSELVAEGGLSETNDAQLVTFEKPVAAAQLVFVGLSSLQNKGDMSASDIKVVPCKPAPTPKQGSGATDLVNDLFLQREPFTQKDNHRLRVTFNPAEHTYYATAFYHNNSVVAHADSVSGATVTINGQAANEKGEQTITLTKGWNPITVVVSKDSQTATYVINVRKVDTDYRDREVIQPVTVTTNDSKDGKVMFDGNEGTYWEPTNLVEKEEWSEEVTGFTLTFDEPKNVSKITGAISFTSGRSWDAGRVFKIYGSADGQTFDKELATRAALRNDTIPGYVYWDFNRSETVKAIRIWMTPTTTNELKSAGTQIKFKELQVWQNPGNQAETLPEQPSGDTTSQMYNPSADAQAWGVSRAQALFMKYGIIAPTWVPSGGYGRGSFDKAEQELSGGAFPMFYDLPLFDSSLMKRIPDSYWSLAKAPGGGNSMSNHAQPEQFLTSEMLPYAKNLIDIQYGDEGRYSAAERDRFKQWFDWSKQNLPGAIVHSNQAAGLGWDTLSTMREYVSTAKPDVITWDTYEFTYGNASGDNVTPAMYIQKFFSRQLFNVYRQVGMEGYSGDGTDPVPWGQYIDYSFKSNFSPSQKNFTAMLSLAAGAKWLGNFRMEYTAFDKSSITDADGAPTRAWYEYADIFRAQRSLGRYLTSLNNVYFATQPGDYGSGTNSVYKGFRAGDFNDAATQNATKDWGLINVSASSAPAGFNQGRPGDVVIGYFNKLPGMTDAKAQEVFGNGVSNPKAFLLMNALAGKTMPNAQGLQNRYDNGAAWQTRQDITVTVKTPQAGTVLYRVDHSKDDSVPQPVTLSDKGDGTSTFSVSLDGGMADLFYWSEANLREAADTQRPAEGVAFHPSTVKVDSEQNSNREVAKAEALIDDNVDLFDQTKTPNLATFWHTQWDPSNAPMPHGILVDTTVTKDSPVRQVCGVRLTPRAGVEKDFAKDLSVYAFNSEPSSWPAASGQNRSWEGGTLVKEVSAGQQVTTVLFDQPVTASHLGVAIWGTHAGKPYTSMADLSLLDCTPALSLDPDAITVSAAEADNKVTGRVDHAQPGQKLVLDLFAAGSDRAAKSWPLAAGDDGNVEGELSALSDLAAGTYRAVLFAESDTARTHPLATASLALSVAEEPTPEPSEPGEAGEPTEPSEPVQPVVPGDSGGTGDSGTPVTEPDSGTVDSGTQTDPEPTTVDTGTQTDPGPATVDSETQTDPEPTTVDSGTQTDPDPGTVDAGTQTGSEVSTADKGTQTDPIVPSVTPGTVDTGTQTESGSQVQDKDPETKPDSDAGADTGKPQPEQTAGTPSPDKSAQTPKATKPAGQKDSRLSVTGTTSAVSALLACAFLIGGAAVVRQRRTRR